MVVSVIDFDVIQGCLIEKLKAYVSMKKIDICNSLMVLIKQGLDISNLPRQAAINPDGSNRAVFFACPFAEGLFFTVQCDGGDCRRDRSRYAECLQRHSDVGSGVLVFHFHFLPVACVEQCDSLLLDNREFQSAPDIMYRWLRVAIISCDSVI